MRKITFVCAIAMLVAFALPAQAAVQNVKVGGDITIRGIYRDELDLNEATTDTGYENDAFLMSTVGINVEADLTDNVSATVRLVSQRDIDNDTNASTDVNIDLANITLKEMLYSPLTLIIGRQDIWIGDGFLIGANRQDPDNSISANELTEITSFDAIRAILDYDPWTLNLFWAKIDEGSVTEGELGKSDDIDLYGVNVGYIFGEYDAEMEAYYLCKFDGNVDPSDEIHTIGVRGSFVPVENLDLRGELAYQFGDCGPSTPDAAHNPDGATSYAPAGADREAWAVDVSGEYCWADYAWMPTLGVGYVYLSGEDTPAAGDYEGFDRLYYGKTYSAIREWQEVYYNPDDASASAGNTNEHQIIVNGSLQPTDNILLEGKYLHFVLAEDDAQGKDDIGDEVDLRLTYEYTEDVTFGLLAAWFFPGDVFDGATGNDTASEVIATVSLVF